MDQATEASLARVIADVEAERTTADLLRDQVKAFDRAQRMVAMQLGQVHTLPPSQLAAHQAAVERSFVDVRTSLAALAKQVPHGEVYKWADVWSFPMRNAVYAASLAYYLGAGRLLSKEAAAIVLGVDMLPADCMLLTTEDYLHGLISMVNELPRLAIHAVTHGDFDAPVRIADMVKQVHAAFQVLNLKNDALRKRFDSLKYDVKRVEEILYDIRLRDLQGRTDMPLGLAVVVPEAEAAALLQRLAGRAA
ncbi:translin [Malassezia pachydermatis]|uniref:Translin n=1 Tax=Malassezia pachydermatis TaxID=77020 RepID=A0A0M8MMD0_9BASI|nr:translin [Malassezia pachydermatis]KOS14468.1 translin [Malassezia pachydermatis]